MSKNVIRANVLPTPPLVVHLELTDIDGEEREIKLEAELLTFNHIWDPEREIDIPEGDKRAATRTTALIFLNQLTEESWKELSEAIGKNTREEALEWLVGQPVGTEAFRSAVDLGDKLAELSHPEETEEKKKRTGSLPGTMYLLSLASASGWILAAWALGLPDRLLRFIMNFG